MGYHVKQEKPCRLCGVPTTHRRSGYKDAQCFECGLSRMVTNIKTQVEMKGALDRKASEAFVAWVDNGGPDETEMPASWKRGQRKRAEVLRQFLRDTPPKESANTHS